MSCAGADPETCRCLELLKHAETTDPRQVLKPVYLMDDELCFSSCPDFLIKQFKIPPVRKTIQFNTASILLYSGSLKPDGQVLQRLGSVCYVINFESQGLRIRRFLPRRQTEGVTSAQN
jgi:hypothetical protein